MTTIMGLPLAGRSGWVEKGVRHLLCEAPFGPFRQKVPDPFFNSVAHRPKIVPPLAQPNADAVD
jgi:hypothetical protein